MEAIDDEPAFDVEHGETIKAALAMYRTRSIDLQNCFLAAVASRRRTRVLSFDDDLRRLGIGEKP